MTYRLFFLLLAGCPKTEDTGHVGQGGNISVEPDRVDFGEVNAGDTVEQVLVVTNTGLDNLYMGGVELQDDSGSFAVDDHELGEVIAPGDSERLLVTFSPQAVNQEAQLLIASSDGDTPQLTVRLEGQGLVPELALIPDAVDFGGVYVGCGGQAEVKIRNTGTGDAVLTDLLVEGDAFSLPSAPTLPATVPPETEILLSVAFLPQGALSYEGRLEMGVKGLDAERVPLKGMGQWVGETTETPVPTHPPVDVLWVVDPTEDATDLRLALADEGAAWFTALGSWTSDWQVVTTADLGGCGSSKVISPSSTDAARKFWDGVKSVDATTWDASWHSGLQAAAAAVEMTDDFECNYGFLRSNALLSVVVVSTDYDHGPDGWRSYLDRLQARKADPSLARVAAVAVDTSLSCDGPFTGTGYQEAADATGGVFLTACETWDTLLPTLAANGAGRSLVTLSGTTSEESLQVLVNGVSTTDWTWVPAWNGLLFAEGALGPTDTVAVTYGTRAESCP